jgi:hypothetical protein
LLVTYAYGRRMKKPALNLAIDGASTRWSRGVCTTQIAVFPRQEIRSQQAAKPDGCVLRGRQRSHSRLQTAGCSQTHELMNSNDSETRSHHTVLDMHRRVVPAPRGSPSQASSLGYSAASDAGRPSNRIAVNRQRTQSTILFRNVVSLDIFPGGVNLRKVEATRITTQVTWLGPSCNYPDDCLSIRFCF